jgi:DNA-binding phage protein
LRSFRTKVDPARQLVLAVLGSFDRGLRAAYAAEFTAGKTNKSRLAQKMGIHRSVIGRRLAGATNMTIETLAETVTALGWGVEPRFYRLADEQPSSNHYQYFDAGSAPTAPPADEVAPPMSGSISTMAGPFSRSAGASDPEPEGTGALSNRFLVGAA